LNIVRVDERYTSKMAFQTMIDAGIKKKDRQNKALIDKISAVIILQTYLQQIDIENNRLNETK
ncbi:MAG TPA: Holliday junction resolvase RuvX, partial [Bacteroidales bacterium]|nr:Holliday junction resolvase RuvX [Bacteroidales bacterium]